ncbi:copper chaperone PCu(A)C [Streptomyces sp. NPDC003691]
MITAVAAGAVAAALTLTGCSTDSSASTGSGSSNGRPDAPELTVSGEFMPQPVSDMAAGFLTVRNGGGKADTLTSVTSPLSDTITIHESKGQRMRKVDSFPIPADGKLALERGGNHIMFEGLKERPKKGEKVSVELRFEKSDPIRVELPVMDTGYNPAKSAPEAPAGGGPSEHTPENTSEHTSEHH